MEININMEMNILQYKVKFMILIIPITIIKILL